MAKFSFVLIGCYDCETFWLEATQFKCIKAPVADIGFWTLVANIGFWTLVADFAFWTQVADFAFWSLVADVAI